MNRKTRLYKEENYDVKEKEKKNDVIISCNEV